MLNAVDRLHKFYKGKKVLITGHTGFKGTWMCGVLKYLEAEVVGFSLKPPTNPSLFELSNMQERITSYLGDVRNLDELENVFQKEKPEIVIHMAAQPIVRTSYEKPVYTYEVNVMGTVHLMECIRRTPSVKSVINVTTDKVYKNKEQNIGYVESDELNGFDPYSNSKSCSELVTDSYKNSFLNELGIAVSTMRAGNVIGGGDYAKDRIVPDCIRAATKGESILIRNPYSVRPFQHVLEPVVTYLIMAMEQWENAELAGCYNVGPEREDCISAGQIVELFCNSWKSITNKECDWKNISTDGPHEAGLLMLDCTKIRKTIGWNPRWNVKEAVERTVEFTWDVLEDKNVYNCMINQIKIFLKCDI